jgi:ribitol 2-dehydrogenase
MIDLTDKVFAVTGAASGIGAAIAKALLAVGAKVTLCDCAEDRLRSLTATLGPDAFPLTVDLTNRSEVAGVLDKVLTRFGRLDGVLANAGLYVGGDVLGGDPDSWDRLLAVNVNSVFRLVHAVLPYMVEQRSGDIIATCSISGHVAIPQEPIYSASKHAVLAFLRARLAPAGGALRRARRRGGAGHRHHPASRQLDAGEPQEPAGGQGWFAAGRNRRGRRVHADSSASRHCP